jgi:23S rRNA pseudouridine1911/1915/1917 synthase
MASIMRELTNAPQESLAVLYEDDSLLAIDKPAGVVVHPTYRNAAGTLLDALAAREPGARFFLAGRLDRMTSGVVIALKSRETYVAVQRAWPEAEKDYLAVVHGRVEPACGEIALRLGPDSSDRRRRAASETLGAPSLTRFERIAYSDQCPGGLSLLRCRLGTGRRHQIRVHLSARGWPVVGDAVYGRPGSPAFPRQALHAWRIALRHPGSGTHLRLEAPIPPDLCQLLAEARLSLPA